MQRGEHASLTALTTKELHATGSHELLNGGAARRRDARACARALLR